MKFPGTPPFPQRPRRRGAVLLIVLVAMMFGALALVALIERASTDMLVDVKHSDAARLRTEAYSAAESTLSVLAAFKEVIGDLHSPSEGWGDPLAFCGYEPGEGRKVEVSLEDESGRIPLSSIEPTAMLNVLKSWGLEQDKAEKVADGILGWMRKDYVASSGILADADVYDRAEIPFAPPYRVMRSFDELATIAGARDVFYDEKGVPNELFAHFTETFSLYDYKAPNINAAVGDVLAMESLPDAGLQKQLRDFLGGTGAYQGRGKGFFKSTGDLGTVLGSNVSVTNLDTVVRALRVRVTVSEGSSRYELSLLVAPPGGAKVPKPAVEEPKDVVKDSEDPAAKTTATAGQSGTTTSDQTGADASMDEKKNLKYPFAVLEISENDRASRPIESSLPTTP